MPTSHTPCHLCRGTVKTVRIHDAIVTECPACLTNELYEEVLRYQATVKRAVDLARLGGLNDAEQARAACVAMASTLQTVFQQAQQAAFSFRRRSGGCETPQQHEPAGLEPGEEALLDTE